MYLSRGAAQRIVEHIATHLGLQTWVLDRTSEVLAGTSDDSSWLSTLAPRAAALDGAALDGEPPEAGTGANAGTNDSFRSFPLHYAGEQIGTLFVACAGGPSDEVAHVAKVMADLIIRQTTDVEQLIDRQWALNRFVYELLLARFRDRPEDWIWQEAKLLNIDLEVPRVVALVQVTPLLDHLQRSTRYPTPAVDGYRRQRHQLRRYLLRQAQALIQVSEASIFSYLDEQQLVLLAAVDPGCGDRWRGHLQGELQRFVDELKRTNGVDVSAGVGDYYGSWQLLPNSYRDAQMAAKGGLAMFGSGRVCTLADLGLAAFLCGDHRATSSRLAAQLLQPLDGSPELLETLDVFLGANLSPSLAAQKLHIHRHTLTYRLEHIARLTGLNPREFGAAAQLYAALLSHKLVGIEH